MHSGAWILGSCGRKVPGLDGFSHALACTRHNILASGRLRNGYRGCAEDCGSKRNRWGPHTSCAGATARPRAMRKTDRRWDDERWRTTSDRLGLPLSRNLKSGCFSAQVSRAISAIDIHRPRALDLSCAGPHALHRDEPDVGTHQAGYYHESGYPSRLWSVACLPNRRPDAAPTRKPGWLEYPLRRVQILISPQNLLGFRGGADSPDLGRPTVVLGHTRYSTDLSQVNTQHIS